MTRLAAVSLFALSLGFVACKQPIHGEFGWSAVDNREIGEPEQSLLVETEFKFGRKNLYFYDYQTIWWIYRIDGGRFEAGQFLAALYENNNTPEPVEANMRHVTVTRTEGEPALIREYYEPLKAGKYLLKIAHKSDVVDQVNLTVVPAGGPAAMVDPNFESEPDPILRYSR